MTPEIMTLEFMIKTGTWQELKDSAQAVRLAVFVEEQQVPVELEWDEADQTSLHAVAWVGTEAVGTGRLLPDGHIGRMAVLKNWRGRTMGSAILRCLLQQAGHHDCLMLHAQITAVPFYLKFGFTPVGEAFMEAGIAHVLMVRHQPMDDAVTPPTHD